MVDVDPVSLPDRLFAEQVASELSRELDAWRDDGPQLWNLIRLKVVPGRTFGAEVEMDGSTGWSSIAIFEHAIIRLRGTLRSFLNTPTSLVIHWQKVGSPRIELDDFGTIAAAHGGTPQQNRAWLADYLATTAARYLYYHELAHIIRGHLAYELERSGRARFAYSELDGYRSVPPRRRGLWRAFEMDADMVGADIFSRMTALRTWRALPLADRRRLCALALFASATTFLLLDLDHQRERMGGVHQPPFSRFLVLLDTLSPALARELRLRGASMRHAVHAAVGWIGRYADHLGNTDPRWPARDSAGWRAGLRRHARAVRDTSDIMEHLLAGRSTLLPDVGSGSATASRGGRTTNAARNRR